MIITRYVRDSGEGVLLGCSLFSRLHRLVLLGLRITSTSGGLRGRQMVMRRSPRERYIHKHSEATICFVHNRSNLIKLIVETESYADTYFIACSDVHPHRREDTRAITAFLLTLLRKNDLRF